MYNSIWTFSRFNLAWISAISSSRKLMICVDGQKSTKENVYSHRWALLSWVQLLHCTTEKNDRKKNVLCSQHLNCNKFSNTGKPHYMDSHFRNTDTLFRVVKSVWLPAKITAYLASISWLLFLAFLYGWRFLNEISLDWPVTLTTELSTSKLSDKPAHYYGQFSSSLGKALTLSLNSTC